MQFPRFSLGLWPLRGGNSSAGSGPLFYFRLSTCIHTHALPLARSHAHTLAQPLHSTQGVSVLPAVYFHLSLFLDPIYAPLAMQKMHNTRQLSLTFRFSNAHSFCREHFDLFLLCLCLSRAGQHLTIVSIYRVVLVSIVNDTFCWSFWTFFPRPIVRNLYLLSLL